MKSFLKKIKAVNETGTVRIFEGKLHIQTGKVKDVSKQLMANPKAEICAMKNGDWIHRRIYESRF